MYVVNTISLYFHHSLYSHLWNLVISPLPTEALLQLSDNFWKIYVGNVISLYFHHSLEILFRKCSLFKMKVCILTVSLIYFLANSHLSAGWIWTVTALKLKYIFSGVKTNTRQLTYTLLPLFFRTTSPAEFCPQNSDILLTVTRTAAFQTT